MALSPWTRLLNTLQIRNTYTHPPAGLQWRSNTPFILTTVAIALFTDLFLYGLIVPILPFMLSTRLNLPDAQIQSYTSFLLAAYAGASVIFSPIAGFLADKVATRQGPFLVGLVALLGATGLLFVGRTVPVLVAARVLQGMSSGTVWTIGLAMCVETVGAENLGKTIGTMFSFVSGGSLWGPFLGGLLYKKTGYNGVMGVCFAVIGLDFVMRALMIEKKVARRYEGIDGSEDERNDTSNEDSTDDEQQPLLPRSDEIEEEEFKISHDQPRLAKIIPILPCLSNTSLLTALWLALIQAALYGACDATIATVSRDLFDFDSLQAGVLFLPLLGADLIFSPLFGWCVDRYGTKPVAILSYAILVPILVLLRLPHQGGMDQIVLYGGLLALLGIGLSGINAPSIVEAGSIMQKYHEKNKDFFGERGPYAQLYAMNSMLYNVGLTVGPELAGELKEAIGYGDMNIVLAIICAVTAVLSYLYIGGKPRMLKRKV